MSCQEMERWFSEGRIAREAGNELSPELRAHAGTCPRCQAMLWQRFGETWIRSALSPAPQPPDFQGKIAERVLAEIRERQKAGRQPYLEPSLPLWQAALRAVPALVLLLALLGAWTYRQMDWTELARLSPSERYVLTLEAEVGQQELLEEVMDIGLARVEP